MKAGVQIYRDKNGLRPRYPGQRPAPGNEPAALLIAVFPSGTAPTWRIGSRVNISGSARSQIRSEWDFKPMSLGDRFAYKDFAEWVSKISSRWSLTFER